MDTFTKTLTAIETTFTKDVIVTKSYVKKKVPIILSNIANWITNNPKKALAIVFFIVGFILGTLV